MIRKIAVRDVNKHRLVVFVAGILIDKAGPETLDLYASTCLLLDVLDEHALRADHLCTDVEVANRFESDGNLCFGPFALYNPSQCVITG